ncbi:MAG: hypothetical protein AB7F89_09190 [Pirellulaceae bacterium]
MPTSRDLLLKGVLLIGYVVCVGCATVPLPAIDPTGERIFLPSPSYTTIASPYDSLSGYTCLPRPAFPEPPPIPPCEELGPPRPPDGLVGTGVAPVTVLPTPDRLTLSPAKIVAPIHSEVVLLAGLCGHDGFYVTKQPIEWMLSPDSVGNIIALADSAHPHLAKLAHHSPRKESNNLATTRTSTAAHHVTRGTPQPNDDIWVSKGQTWISVSSPTEGISHVTALAKEAENWETRRQTATIYWVDMQWVFPAPRIVRAGEPSMLQTTVTKTSTGNPAANALVRYEVVGGAPAYFEAGRTTIEVPTDANGHATVQLFQDPVGPGTTQVRVQVMSAAWQGDSGSRANIGQGFTTITWSSPGLALRMGGPALVARNGIATYRIEASNPGDVATERVTVTLELPRSLKFLNSEPGARVLGDRLEWTFGTLEPHAVRGIQINCQALNGGEFTLTSRATAGTAQVAAATASAQTQVVESGLTVRFVDPPTSSTVGSRVEFNFEVTNTGGLPLTNLVVRDRYDPGLQPAYQLDPNQTSGLLELRLGNLAAGATLQKGVAFVARQPGQLCHALEVTADGGHTTSTQACVNVAQPVLRLDLRKAGPEQARVGDQVRFTIHVTNTGEGVLTNLQIADLPDAALRPERATQKWQAPNRRASDGAVLWQIPSLSPNQTEILEMECSCLTAAAAARNQVEAVADGGVRETGVVQLEIQPAAPAPPPSQPQVPPASQPQVPPPGVSAKPTPPTETGELQIQLVDFRDPVPVGEGASWIIIVRNLTSRPESDLQIILTIPDAFDLRSASVSQDSGAGVVLVPEGIAIGPIRSLRGNDTIPRIRVEGVTATRPGDYTIRVRVESRTAPTAQDENQITVTPRARPAVP